MKPKMDKLDLLDGGFTQYFPPYKKTKYYSNQLYRIYDRKMLDSEPRKVLVGYIRIPDRENITMDFMPNLHILHIPLFAWEDYSHGQLHFKGKEIYHWICNRVTPSNRNNIYSLLRDVGIDEYDAVSLFVWANGKFSNDSIYIVPCDESKEKPYKDIMKMDRFTPGEISKTPEWW